MFTGIIQSVIDVKQVQKGEGFTTIIFYFPDYMLQDLKIGASVAIDGTCLTVVHMEDHDVTFNVITETLTRTTLDNLEVGHSVNAERSAHIGDEIGGHIVSGHINGKAKILKIDTSNNNYIIHFELPNPWIKYVFTKGFIALNGASLTVVDVNKAENSFTVHLIPETLRATTFLDKKSGDLVNFEVEYQTKVTVDTVENYLLTLATNANSINI